MPVSWLKEVYSQGEKGLFLGREASPLQHSEQKCIVARTVDGM